MIKHTGQQWEPYHYETKPPHTPVSYLMLISETQYIVAGRRYGLFDTGKPIFYYLMRDGATVEHGKRHPSSMDEAKRFCEKEFLQKGGEQLKLL